MPRCLPSLADGEQWSSSALALALGTSQRTVQRALDALAVAGKVQALGRGRARRWMTPPLPGFATTLLLPAPLPGGEYLREPSTRIARAGFRPTRRMHDETSKAEIIREYGPFPEVEQVGGVSFDGEHVWFASGTRLNASIRRAAGSCARSTSPRMPAPRSTASICSRSPRSRSRRSIRKPGACSPRFRRPAAAVTPASPGPKARSGSASTGNGRSIRSIRRPERSCAPSSPTASSPASPGSMASCGTAPGKTTRAICGASIRRRARCWS